VARITIQGTNHVGFTVTGQALELNRIYRYRRDSTEPPLAGVLMSLFDIAAVLISLSAAFGYINHRTLKLDPAVGLLLMSLASSLSLLALHWIFPQMDLLTQIQAWVSDFDFNETLMHGMLGFLLFAAALHIDLDQFLGHWRAIASLATIGLLISTALVGGMSWMVFNALGLDISLIHCLIFGSLISPTDPIAVMGSLKSLHAPASLKALIAGESLFNDGVAVVVFSVLVMTMGGSAVGHGPAPDGMQIAIFFLREAGGGALLGLISGYAAYRLMLSIDDYLLEVLITLALVMGGYSLGWALHVSAPIAMVVAGIFVGNRARNEAMSAQVSDYVTKFWELIDEFLNGVLFMLIGVEVLVVTLSKAGLLAGLIMILVVLGSRFLSISGPISILRHWNSFPRGTIRILSWAGLRGGISVALALSLPSGPERNLIVTSTYVVVLFSIIVQGLTMKKLLRKFV
jgi:CPA1 family monovalent cation:H+ antiporter